MAGRGGPGRLEPGRPRNGWRPSRCWRRCWPEEAEAVVPKLLAAASRRRFRLPPCVPWPVRAGLLWPPRLSGSGAIWAWRRAASSWPRLLDHISWRRSFFALERQTIVPSELDAPTREALLHLADAGLRSRASALLAKFVPPDRSSVLAKYRPALNWKEIDGEGEAVFSRTCQTCHQHQGRGYRVGPDLSGVMRPSCRGIVERHPRSQPRGCSRLRHDRRGHAVGPSGHGAARGGDRSDLEASPRRGLEETLLRSEIEQVRSTGQSLMPEGLEQGLSLQDMADLIAFLRGGSTR